MLLAAVLSGCGYVGAPLPPALYIPVPVSGFSATQRSGQIEIRFTPSLESTDGMVLERLSAIELRAGENPEGAGFQIDSWAAGARRIEVAGIKAEQIVVRVPVAGWEGKDVVIAVRPIGPRGRPGIWSPPQVLRVVAAPEAPAGLTAESAPGGVLVTWNPGAPGVVRIYRRAARDESESLAGESAESKFLDTAAVVGTEYVYRAQRVVASEGSAAESPYSAPAAITAQDTFPPAVPVNLVIQAGIGAVELAWDRNTEPDIAGYRVWRSLGDEALKPLGEQVATASFSDKTVKAGKRYRYAVSAIDMSGNESQPCEPAGVLYQ
ncbi:MAG: hypothetical protein C0504_12120 [Candidatus Solibacter sp.]|nr:hypothetical protein [Candidatus Solibacter sp.]